jgi:hypothetical protein
MSETSGPHITDQENIAQLSHRRILQVMGLIVIFGSLICFFYVSGLFAAGFLIGGILSFVNYYWLKSSLKRVFAEAAGGEKPRVSASRYVLRYAVLGAIIGFVFLTHIVPVASVIFGLTSFALAVVIEAMIRIFLTIFNRKEI